MRKLFCVLFAGILTIFSSAAYAAVTSQITVTGAWVQAVPPSSPTSAAYMTIANNSSQQEVLVSASSGIAGAAEIHEMSEAGGMMKMSMVSSLAIPAGGKVTLEPGGYHIMLIGLKKPVNPGDIVPVILYFKDGQDVKVNADVRNP